MRKSFFLIACGLYSAMALTAPTCAATSFQQGVNDYNAGKYALALSELQPYEAAYPNNAMVHYYIALCHQALNHLDQAKTEYSWVIEHGDLKLKAMAQTGFSRLANAHTSVSTAAPRPTGGGGAATGFGATGAAPVVAVSKVKKVIEFYADW